MTLPTVQADLFAWTVDAQLKGHCGLDSFAIGSEGTPSLRIVLLRLLENTVNDGLRRTALAALAATVTSTAMADVTLKHGLYTRVFGNPAGLERATGCTYMDLYEFTGNAVTMPMREMCKASSFMKTATGYSFIETCPAPTPDEPYYITPTSDTEFELSSDREINGQASVKYRWCDADFATHRTKREAFYVAAKQKAGQSETNAWKCPALDLSAFQRTSPGSASG